MQEFVNACFSGPALPASILLILVSIYWLFVIVGALDFDLFDFDFDADMDADGEVLSVGFVTLRFLNLGEVPLMLWMSVFALSLWTLTMGLAAYFEPAESAHAFWPSALVFARNAGVAVLLTKLITQPLRGRFDPVEPNRAKDLIGRICTITTSEVSQTAGQARYETEAAPLLLNVRSGEGTLARGDLAEIIDYDTEQHVYFVRSANREV